MMPIRILNLEDDPHDSELVRHELGRAGIDAAVTRVVGTAEFEAALRNAPPDVILSDHGLPELDGHGALRLARQVAPDVPFILLTGSLDEEAAVAYMKAGATDYILKDRMARLGPAILEALENARGRRALARYPDFLRQIIDANPSLIVVRDARGQVLLANRAAASAYGVTVEDMVGRSERALSADPESSARFLEADQEALESGRPVFLPDHPFRDADGRRRYLQVVTVPLLLPGSDDPAALAVATDVTERRRLRDQLQQAQKMEAVGQLAGGVAHDFNNVLTAILGHADLALETLPPGAAERTDVEAIRAAAQHAAALTRQLLAFSRKQILQPRNIDLNGLVRELERMIRRLVAANIEIDLQLAPDLGVVRADPAQLGQVVLNLVVNAQDAMPGGGRLVLATANVEAGLAAEGLARPVPAVALRVADSGTGMDEETRTRAFEPFFTTKGPGKGTGLGLSTVYGIVRQSGGTVAIESEPGRGTAVTVHLPRVDAPAAEVEPGPAAAGGGDETILLVEDSEAVRRLTAQILRRRGYTVLEAGDAVTAERAAVAHAGPIHLLLTDVVMPGVSGRELASRLQAMRPGIRVLYTSGYTDDAILHHGVMTDHMAFLQKPFATDDLLQAVRAAIAGPPGA
jgi:two-component system, cell cycle sensor histidine kinase and response regulator CckA